MATSIASSEASIFRDSKSKRSEGSRLLSETSDVGGLGSVVGRKKQKSAFPGSFKMSLPTKTPDLPYSKEEKSRKYHDLQRKRVSNEFEEYEALKHQMLNPEEDDMDAETAVVEADPRPIYPTDRVFYKWGMDCFVSSGYRKNLRRVAVKKELKSLSEGNKNRERDIHILEKQLETIHLAHENARRLLLKFFRKLAPMEEKRRGMFDHEKKQLQAKITDIEIEMNHIQHKITVKKIRYQKVAGRITQLETDPRQEPDIDATNEFLDTMDRLYIFEEDMDSQIQRADAFFSSFNKQGAVDEAITTNMERENLIEVSNEMNFNAPVNAQPMADTFKELEAMAMEEYRRDQRLSEAQIMDTRPVREQETYPDEACTDDISTHEIPTTAYLDTVYPSLKKLI